MADEEPLRRCIIEASRRHALEGRSTPPTFSIGSPVVFAAGVFAAGLLFGARRSLARTAALLGACGCLVAMMIGKRQQKLEIVAEDQSIEHSDIDEASRLSFPASDPPALRRG